MWPSQPTIKLPHLQAFTQKVLVFVIYNNHYNHLATCIIITTPPATPSLISWTVLAGCSNILDTFPLFLSQRSWLPVVSPLIIYNTFLFTVLQDIHKNHHKIITTTSDKTIIGFMPMGGFIHNMALIIIKRGDQKCWLNLLHTSVHIKWLSIDNILFPNQLKGMATQVLS